jgi:MFS family permease
MVILNQNPKLFFVGHYPQGQALVSAPVAANNGGQTWLPQAHWLGQPEVITLILLVVLFLCSLVVRHFQTRARDGISSAQETDGYWSLVVSLRNIWPAIITAGLVDGAMGPIVSYISLNFFAQHYTHLDAAHIRCETDMGMQYCARAVNDNVTWTTRMNILHALVQICLGPCLGMLADSFGRRPAIIGCKILTIFPLIAQALFLYYNTSLYLWYALQVFDFLPIAALWFSLITDVFDRIEDRASAFGLLLVGWELASIVGMVASASLTLKAIVSACLIVKCFHIAYLIFCIHETLPHDKRAPMRIDSSTPFVGFGILFRTSTLQLLCVVLLVSVFVGAGKTPILMSYLQKYLQFRQYDSFIAGIISRLSVLGWLGCLMQPIIGLAGQVGLLFVCVIIGALQNISLYFVTSASQVFALFGAFAGVSAIAFPVTAAMGSLVAGNEQGHFQGAMQGVQTLAGCLGPIVFGIMFNWFDWLDSTSGLGWLGRPHAALLFLIAAFIYCCLLPVIACLPRDFIGKSSEVK